MSLLDKINHPNDIKKISPSEYDLLADEIRSFLIESVSHTGGHLASNLGVVELTMALHLAMNLPNDKIVWDVGHQSYTHKILTGRKEEFKSLRQFEGMSGFPKTEESNCDPFNTGHSSTSISAVLGLAEAREKLNKKQKICAVIGDGSMTGGMVYEALNQMGQEKTGCVIVLNDNEMSIDKNVGGMSRYMNHLRSGVAYNEFKQDVETAFMKIPDVGVRMAKGIKRSKDSIKGLFMPGMFFEDLGITYIGPVDGHNIPEMVDTFKRAFRLNKPIIVHVKTVKGKGYKPAENYPTHFHGVSPFDVETGHDLVEKKKATYTDVFGRKMLQIGAENENVIAITAAMASGTGVAAFKKKYPDRFYDVGIAEQHGVTFAAGLAAAGLTPVVCIYSSFLQRAYDQILHDVCLQNLHVIFAIDRSGLVGNDGETHQGIYDTGFLSQMPNMTILAPKCAKELEKALDFALTLDGPVAIKYPRGEVFRDYSVTDFEYGKSEIECKGSKVAIIGCGNMLETAKEVKKILQEKTLDMSNSDSAKMNPMVINARFLKPMDTKLLDALSENFEIVAVIEEQTMAGSYMEKVASYMATHANNQAKCLLYGIRQESVKHGSVSELRKMLGLTAEQIAEDIMKSRMNP